MRHIVSSFKLGRSQNLISFNDKYTQLRYVNIWLRPLQQPHPPVWIPGGGSIETWDFCLEHDYMYSYLSHYGYKRAAQMMKGFWDKTTSVGKDLNPYRAGYAQIVCVADSEEEAERLYSPPIDYFFNRCLHVYPGFADAPGYRTQATLRAGFTPRWVVPPRPCANYGVEGFRGQWFCDCR